MQESRNAFLEEKDPLTKRAWRDRHGFVFGKGIRKGFGNVEKYMNYGKLKRTGRLLRSIKTTKLPTNESGWQQVSIGSTVPYASDHEKGTENGASKLLKPPLVGNGAKGVIVGGAIHARPFLKPSKRVLKAPYKTVKKILKANEW